MTIERDIRNWNYTKAILTNCYSSGIKTMDDLVELEKKKQLQSTYRFSNKRKDPIEALEEYKRKVRLEREEII